MTIKRPALTHWFTHGEQSSWLSWGSTNTTMRPPELDTNAVGLKPIVPSQSAESVLYLKPASHKHKKEPSVFRHSPRMHTSSLLHSSTSMIGIKERRKENNYERYVIKCIQTVFTLLHFFHILLCYSLIPCCIKLNSLVKTHKHPIMTLSQTLLNTLLISGSRYSLKCF